MLAVIPYTTFPTIELGPLTLRTFGLFVALGVLVGAWLAAGYAERFGISRDETYRVATWMVLAGIVGSRLTWVATHPDAIDEPVDVIAIWEGGIQFSGGFLTALVVGLPFFRRWTRLQRWQVLDGYAFGLAIGLALGRVGCYSVGEHFGRRSDFFLATRYDGGEVREPLLGDVPLRVGTSFHNTSLYELIFLLVLFAGMGALIWRARRRQREVAPGTLVGLFIVYYGVARFLTDALRVNDERVLSMTGAQWMSLAMVPAGAWILWKVRPRMAKLAAESAESEAKPADAADSDSDSDSDSESESESESEPAGSADAKAESESESESDVKAEAEPESESESEAKPADAADSEPESDVKAESEAKPAEAAGSEPDSESESEAKPAEAAEPDSESESESEAKAAAETAGPEEATAEPETAASAGGETGSEAKAAETGSAAGDGAASEAGVEADDEAGSRA